MSPSVGQSIFVGVVLALAAALIGFGVPRFLNPPKAQTVVSQSIAVKCPNSNGQKCSRSWATEFSLPRPGKLQIQYRVPPVSPTHCSPTEFWFYVDGELVDKTGTLGWVGNKMGLPLSQTIVTGIVNQGSHQLVLQGYGVKGGCNEGTITSHQGIITVTLEP